MDRDFESIANDAEHLAPHEQFLLTERLARKLGASREHREAWAEESRRRAEAIDRGEMQTIDAADALRNIRNIIRK